eukprot:gene4106-4793_t
MGQTPAAPGAPSVVPMPQSITYGSGSINLNPSDFTIKTTAESVTFDVAIKRYQKLFFPFGPGAHTTGDANTLTIEVASSSEDLQLGVDETYTIDASESALAISAKTIYGAMRALETFAQLIVYNQANDSYTIPFLPIAVNDYPRFQWRGFMIDTGRHYFTTSFILHMIDSLGYNKFNVLHWHIVDCQSFAVQSESYPKLTDAAYNPRAIYTHDDIIEVIAYAKTYGIRVVLEVDIPGHTGSWFVGYPELKSNCPSWDWYLSNQVLNPSLPETYEVVEGILTEMSSLALDNFFHTGGDEVILDCWNEDASIQAWMDKEGFNSSQAEQYFEDKVDGILAKLGRTKITWNDPFINNVTLIPSTVIQVWDSAMQNILDAGYKVLVSYAYYLDQQEPMGVYHDEFQDTWETFYNSDPADGVTNNVDLIIGGEGCMWDEQVNQLSWDVRVWPRSIGIGERLWSAQNVNSTDEALPRIEQFSCTMAKRGIQSGPLFPDYCLLPYERPHTQRPLFRLDKETIKAVYGK